MNPQNGKGSTQRPEAKAGSYAEGYERIFRVGQQGELTELSKDATSAKDGPNLTRAE